MSCTTATRLVHGAQRREHIRAGFATAASGSFGLAATAYILITSASFLTFGGNSDNYSPSPRPVSNALPCCFHWRQRADDLSDSLYRVPWRRVRSTVVMLSCGSITLTVVFVTDLGMISADGGGTIASFMHFGLVQSTRSPTMSA